MSQIQNLLNLYEYTVLNKMSQKKWRKESICSSCYVLTVMTFDMLLFIDEISWQRMFFSHSNDSVFIHFNFAHSLALVIN